MQGVVDEVLWTCKHSMAGEYRIAKFLQTKAYADTRVAC